MPQPGSFTGRVQLLCSSTRSLQSDHKSRTELLTTKPKPLDDPEPRSRDSRTSRNPGHPAGGAKTVSLVTRIARQRGPLSCTGAAGSTPQVAGQVSTVPMCDSAQSHL